MTEDCHFKWSSDPLYLPVPGFAKMPSVFLDECVTHLATVEDVVIITKAGKNLCEISMHDVYIFCKRNERSNNGR